MPIEQIQTPSINGVSLADAAYQTLRNAILTGDLTEGEPLPEEAIAQQLRMSRTPVREAMRRLVAEGMLREVRPRGLVVSGVVAQDVFDVYTIREELDGLCHRLAASRITPHQQFMLATLTDRMATVLDDPIRFSALTREFHGIVVAAAGNPLLTKIMGDLRSIVDRFPVSALGVEGRTREALDEYRDIVAALERSDPVAAEEAAQRHLRQGLKARLQALRQHELQAEKQPDIAIRD